MLTTSLVTALGVDRPVFSAPLAGGASTPALVTVTGTNLSNLSLSATACKNVTRLTASPTVSTDTTAYFSCTPSGAYTSTILAVSNGGTISSQPLTVPAPIVTMTVSGGGVNGSIVFNLKGKIAPITVDNFLAELDGPEPADIPREPAMREIPLTAIEMERNRRMVSELAGEQPEDMTRLLRNWMNTKG